MLKHLSPALWFALVVSTAGCTPGAFVATVLPPSTSTAAAVSNPSTGTSTPTQAAAPTATVAAYAADGAQPGPIAPPRMASPVNTGSSASSPTSGAPMACTNVIAYPVNTPVVGGQGGATVTLVANTTGSALPIVIPAVPQQPPANATAVASTTAAHPTPMGAPANGPIVAQPAGFCRVAPNGGDPGMDAGSAPSNGLMIPVPPTPAGSH